MRKNLNVRKVKYSPNKSIHYQILLTSVYNTPSEILETEMEIKRAVSTIKRT